MEKHTEIIDGQEVVVKVYKPNPAPKRLGYLSPKMIDARRRKQAAKLGYSIKKRKTRKDKKNKSSKSG